MKLKCEAWGHDRWGGKVGCGQAVVIEERNSAWRCQLKEAESEPPVLPSSLLAAEPPHLLPPDQAADPICAQSGQV